MAQQYEQRDNSGSLFKNERKENENQPAYTGKCMVNGLPMQISAWVKEGKSGKFMSLSLQPKEDKPRQEKKVSEEEDLPF